MYRICLVYRPPGENMDQLSIFLKDLSYFTNTDLSLILLGDFNIRNINWERYTTNSNFGLEFLTFVSTENLTQFVLSPTHISGSILDLIFSRCNNISNVIVDLPFSSSDHNAIVFDFCVSSVNPAKDKMIHDYHHADWSGIFNFLANLDFDNLFIGKSTEDISLLITEIFQNAVHLFVPLIKVNRFNKIKFYSKDTLEAFRRFELAIRRYHRSKSTINRFLKNESHAAFRRLARRDKSSFELKLYQSHKGNFFKYVRKNDSNNLSIPPLIDGGVLVDTDVKKADIFCNFFSSVFTSDNGVLPPLNFGQNYPLIDNLFCTELEIFNILKNLPNKFSSGPDGINNIFLKKCAFFVAKPLHYLFNSAFQSGCVPSSWKDAFIVPIFKKGNKSDPKNYRPVSLTSNIAKIAERHVHFLLSHHCEANRIISSKQHGFLKGRNTTTQLFESIHYYTSQINKSKNTDVVYMDLAKAFDSVSHQKLIHKLRGYGLSGKLLTFVENFLINRIQRVRLNETISKSMIVKSGVPQGTVLGPLLFSLYINDAPNVLQSSEILMFADDCKIYKAINNSVDQMGLQLDLHEFATWCRIWQLKLAPDKCCFHSIGFRNDLESSYSLDGLFLKYEQFVRDLGIYVDDTLRFTYNTQILTRKSYGCMFKLLKMFSSRDPKLMKCLLQTFILPILDYGSQVWSCFLSQADIATLERVQRRFTKKIDGLFNLPYDERLRRLEIDPLEKRRLKFDLLFLHKLRLNDFNLDCSKFVETLDPSGTRTRFYDECKLKQPIARTTTSHSISTTKLIPKYNELDINIRRLTSSKFSKIVPKYL